MTPLERSMQKLEEQARELAVVSAVVTLLPPDLVVGARTVTNYQGKVTVSFTVENLAQLRALIKSLPYEAQVGKGPIELELGSRYGYHLTNNYSWYWKAFNGQVMRINVQCNEPIGEAKADKKIKYYYNPRFEIDYEKFGVFEPKTARPFGGGGYDNRNEYPPTFNLTWHEDEPIFYELQE